MKFIDGDTEEEEAQRYLEEANAYNVKKEAYKPPLAMVSETGYYNLYWSRPTINALLLSSADKSLSRWPIPCLHPWIWHTRYTV